MCNAVYGEDAGGWIRNPFSHDIDRKPFQYISKYFTGLIQGYFAIMIFDGILKQLVYWPLGIKCKLCGRDK